MEANTITRADRIRGMIWGQFIGDAAALGTHWVYDLDALQAAYPRGIKGFEAPGLAPYHVDKAPGAQTHYGDAALLLLESCAERGGFDLADFAARFIAFFGAPGATSYKDHSTRETLAHLAKDRRNLANGADDDQPATVTRLAPLLALPEFEPGQVDALTTFCQKNARAIAFARAHSAILSALLDGAEFSAALDCVAEAEPAAGITAAREAIDRSEIEFTLEVGQGCPLPKTFPSAVHAALRHPTDFRAGILAALASGGDNAARACMVGTWLGASLGVQAIPMDWREKSFVLQKNHKSVEALLTKSA